jgi:hypothetical protein
MIQSGHLLSIRPLNTLYLNPGKLYATKLSCITATNPAVGTVCFCDVLPSYRNGQQMKIINITVALSTKVLTLQKGLWKMMLFMY